MITKHSEKKTEVQTQIPEGSPVEYKNVDTIWETASPFPHLLATELIFALSDKLRLRKSDHIPFYLLEKGSLRLKIGEEELREVMKVEEQINLTILQLQYMYKDVTFKQHLGENIHVSIQTPYNCVDIRQFWVIPNTEQIHPTKTGIALQISEFWSLMKLLKELIDRHWNIFKDIIVKENGWDDPNPLFILIKLAG